MDNIDISRLADIMQQLEQSKNLRRLIWGGLFIASLYGFSAFFGGLSELLAVVLK